MKAHTYRGYTITPYKVRTEPYGRIRTVWMSRDSDGKILGHGIAPGWGQSSSLDRAKVQIDTFVARFSEKGAA